MKPKINKTIYANVSIETKKALVEYCESTGRKMNFVVEKAIKDFLEFDNKYG